MKKFRFTIISESVLTIDQIWPDGDAPENPTADDAARQFWSCGRDLFGIAQDWNFDQDANLDVTEE